MGSFTEREKRVLFGLVRYPDANDRELAELLAFKHSTVTAIRRRLVERGLFFTAWIPNIAKLGGNLLYFMVGNLPTTTGDLDESFNAVINERFPRVVCAATTGEASFVLGYARDFAEATQDLMNWDRWLAEETSSLPRWTKLVFPLSISPILLNFNYAPLLNSLFGLGEADFTMDPPLSRDPVRLTIKERRVLQALVENPDRPDNTIAGLTGVSRQAVSAMKTRFRDTELLVRRRIPDLKQLDVELLMLVIARFHPSTPLESRRQLFGKLLEGFPASFIISNDVETVVIAAVQDYTDYLAVYQRNSELYRGFLREPPEIHLLPLEKLYCPRDHYYGGIIDELVNHQ